MSFRPLVIASLAVGLTACHQADGPLRSNEDFQQVTVGVAAGDTVFIRTGRGNITVEPATSDTLRVRGTLTWRGRDRQPRDVSASATQIGGGYLVCALFGRAECTRDKYTISSRKSFRFGGADDASVNYVVQLPAGVHLDLIGVDGSLTAAASAPVKARTVNGDVTVVTAVGPVRAETVNGSVDARMTTLSGTDSVVVRSMNGNAWVFLPEGVAAAVDISTVNGGLRTDFPSLASSGRATKHLQGVLGAGTTPVRVRTLNGDAGLGRLDAQGRSYDP
jgi:hypothetical protein